MKINRNNYEGFFLLYADGELSVTDNRLVEDFVNDNKDLRGEFETINQTKLKPETLIYTNKKELYRSENTSITHLNYEEAFLLYTDNELGKTELLEVESFIKQNPHLSIELSLLQQTRLIPEAISFGDKTPLYRSEKHTPVYFNWIRIGVAASFIGVLFIYKMNYSKNEQPILRNISEKSAPANLIDSLPYQHFKEVQPLASIQIKNPRQEFHWKKMIHPSENKNTNSEKGTVVSVFNNQPESRIDSKLSLTKEPGSIQEIQRNTTSNLTENNQSTTINPNSEITAKGNPTNEQTIVHQSIYKELDTSEDDNNNSVYIANVSVNKNKLIGLLKRAGKIFTKPSDESDRVAVANFSLDTKALK